MKTLFLISITLALFSCKCPDSKKEKSSLVSTTAPTVTNTIVGIYKEEINLNDPSIKQLLQLVNAPYSTIIKESQVETEWIIHYLGTTVLNGEKAHVFTKFYTVQAAIVKHGHSEMIFITNKTATVYDMEMPEQLALSTKKNRFKFKQENDTISLYLFEANNEQIVFSSN